MAKKQERLGSFCIDGRYFLRYNKCVKKRGRPRKAASERLSKMLHHRVSAEEYRKLSAAAKRAGLPLSDYVRKKLNQ
jgi:predicted HicB family RNase H-like nuclease